MENIYVKGFRSFKKSDKAPEFVLGSLVISLDEFKEFINSNQDLLTEYEGKKQLRVSVLKGRQDNLNFKVDTFKPKENSPF